VEDLQKIQTNRSSLLKWLFIAGATIFTLIAMSLIGIGTWMLISQDSSSPKIVVVTSTNGAEITSTAIPEVGDDSSDSPRNTVNVEVNKTPTSNSGDDENEEEEIATEISVPQDGTRTQTVTRQPTGTPTLTPKPINTKTPTPTPTPKSQEVMLPQDVLDTTISLVTPAEGGQVTNNAFTFYWKWNNNSQDPCLEPPEGYAFEIRIWKDQSGFNQDGAMNAGENKMNVYCEKDSAKENYGLWSFEIGDMKATPGVNGKNLPDFFRWDVAFVQYEPEYKVIFAHESRRMELNIR